ncbi:hypothetical protein ACJQWK_06943 [Exserohilum turcicum]
MTQQPSMAPSPTPHTSLGLPIPSRPPCRLTLSPTAAAPAADCPSTNHLPHHPIPRCMPPPSPASVSIFPCTPCPRATLADQMHLVELAGPQPTMGLAARLG